MKFDIYKMVEKYKLTETETQVLRYILENYEDVPNMAVRDVANVNYTSPATIIKMSKKMGYTGYTDMVYRLNFLIKNRIKNRSLTSTLTSFISQIPGELLERCEKLIHDSKDGLILISATGFSAPLAEYMERKLLVKGFRCIKTNSYAVYDQNKLRADLVIVVSRSGETESIVKVVDYAYENGVSIISFTGEQANHISRISTVNIPVLDDEVLDDRNIQANYFYARIMILFEYLMNQVLEK